MKERNYRLGTKKTLRKKERNDRFGAKNVEKERRKKDKRKNEKRNI